MSSTQSAEISFIDRYQSHIFSEHLPKHKYNPHTDCPHPLRVGAFELQTHIDSSQLAEVVFTLLPPAPSTVQLR